METIGLDNCKGPLPRLRHFGPRTDTFVTSDSARTPHAPQGQMLLCGGSNDASQGKTILSELHGPHSVGLGIFGFFTTREANVLRLVCKEMKSAIAEAEWNDMDTLIKNVPKWTACFPKARSAYVNDLYDYGFDFSVEDHSLDVPEDHFRHFANVRKLCLKNMACSNKALRFLVNLREIECINNINITDEGLASLPNLHSYKLDGNFSDAAFANKDFRHIKKMDLKHCRRVSIDLVRKLTNLTSLDVPGTCISDDMLPNFRGIHTLRTSYANIFSFHNLSGIHTLEVPNCDITDESISFLSGIQNLDISGCQKIKGLTFVALRNIKTLKARDCRFKNNAIAHLAGIESLDISRCYFVNDKSFKHLVGIKHLIAEDTFIADDGFQFLRGIHTLNISNCKCISDKAFLHLQGIKTLIMMHASRRLTDKAFLNLAGIQHLCMDYTYAKRITGAHFSTMAGIKIISAYGCNNDVVSAALKLKRG